MILSPERFRIGELKKMNRKKTITELKKIFKESTDKGNPIPAEEQQIYLDPANVMGIIPKTDIALKLLIENFDVGKPSKIPELKYDNAKRESTANYSIEYIKKVLEFIKCFSDEEKNVFLSVANDYPLTVELKHFKIVLAPRINNE